MLQLISYYALYPTDYKFEQLFEETLNLSRNRFFGDVFILLLTTSSAVRELNNAKFRI